MFIPKGTIWAACIWALHRDPKIYPEPEKFDPERYIIDSVKNFKTIKVFCLRFSAEGRKSRDNCAFIPFGTGKSLNRFAQFD